MVQVQALDDGRYTLVAVGTRRIRVTPGCPTTRTRWPTSTSGPTRDADADGLADPGRRADVAAAPTCSPSPPSSARSQPTSTSTPCPTTRSSPPTTSPRSSPIGPADRYRLLCADGPAERLDLLAECLDDVEAMLRFRLT